MIRLAALLIGLCSLALPIHATTALDLRSRVVIDGRSGDFESDEWVIDASTVFRERPDDSRWGRDNDIAGIAVTWDTYNVYIAVPAVTVQGTLMLFLDTMCGGTEDLTTQNYFLRNIEFGGLTPNLLVQVNRTSPLPIAAYLDCTRPMNLIDNGDYQAVYLQDGVDGGVFELAVPWALVGDFERGSSGVRVPSADATLRVLAVVTGGEGTGAGDAAPDPSVVLEDDSTRVAVVDNHVIIPLDGDGDGLVDMGVSPKEIASYAVPADARGTTQRQVLGLRVSLEGRVFSASLDDRVRFPVVLDSRGYAADVYLSIRVYSAAGYVVRTLLEEAPVDFSSGTVYVEWDFKDDGGQIVPGGIYIVAASGGAGEGTPKNTAKAAFAVVR